MGYLRCRGDFGRYSNQINNYLQRYCLCMKVSKGDATNPTCPRWIHIILNLYGMCQFIVEAYSTSWLVVSWMFISSISIPWTVMSFWFLDLRSYLVARYWDPDKMIQHVQVGIFTIMKIDINRFPILDGLAGWEKYCMNFACKSCAALNW